MSYQKENKTHIHWFREDLRVMDQPFEFLDQFSQFFGAYIIDPEQIAYTDYGFRKMGILRLYHLRESLYELQLAMRERNSDLLIRFGKPSDVLKELCHQYDAQLSYQKGYGTEEIQREKELSHALKTVIIINWEGNFLIHPNEIGLANNHFPKSFSGFRKKAEKISKKLDFSVRKGIDKFPPSPAKFPTIKKPNYTKHELSAIPSHGGCKSGLKRIDSYFFENQDVASYKETRNQLIGKDFSSKFSIYLANGALSPIQIMEKLTIFEQEIIKNKSTYWLYFELLWRDFFRHALRYYERRMFLKNGLNQDSTKVKTKERNFDKWINGETPASFVNANMKELSITGYMSNRGRQNVASFLVHDLGVDWRKGAAWFEHCLIDYDVSSNQGNWMYVAGLGFNPKGKSYFDINFQVKRYDPKHEYIHLWTKQQL
jgi:deoxyribodipyrimidine photo-lyase